MTIKTTLPAIALLLGAGQAAAQCVAPAKHISDFTSVMPSAQPDSLRIPSTHIFQLLTQNGTPYTNSADGNMKGTFDFTGYVPIAGSSANGYIALNHEGGSWPSAGVSILDVAFNDSTKTWKVTNTKPVDFAGIGGTGRNCSGGVTPWGTSITSEETLPTADANSDGYQDIGWNVEIDPVTRKIRDYNNDGVADKIWKMGRMSHENVVAANDSVTVYEGNDENPGRIFKFVAARKGDMTDGTLWVLKLTGSPDTSRSGVWVQVPNSTPTECNNVRTAATSLGATNFDQVEDVEIGTVDGKIYFTSKSSDRVYRFADNGSTVSAFEIFVGNSSTEYMIRADNGTWAEKWLDGNDNLTFDDEGNLYVLQDGGRNHIWVVSPCHTQEKPDVKLFAVTPAGCEPTGMTFSPDYKFMFVSMQHPSSANARYQVDAADSLVRWNKETCIVIARREVLGKGAITPEVPTSVGNMSGEKHFAIRSLYPNPATNAITLDVTSRRSGTAQIRVYGITGNLVHSEQVNLNAGATGIQVNTAALAAGTYNLVLTGNEGNLSTRFVKN